MAAAREDDEVAEELAEHAIRGREILVELKYAGTAGRGSEEWGTLVDLYVQGFEIAVAITSEVKFIEVKLEALRAAGYKVGILNFSLTSSNLYSDRKFKLFRALKKSEVLTWLNNYGLSHLYSLCSKFRLTTDNYTLLPKSKREHNTIT